MSDSKGHKKLGQLAATAICGNDITSSCLYVSALAIIASGKWAPLALLVVAGVLFFYRRIYGEVVGALPLNGGAYNALLNTTSKRTASLAACLTLLSYMATAVISATEATHYGFYLVGEDISSHAKVVEPDEPPPVLLAQAHTDVGIVVPADEEVTEPLSLINPEIAVTMVILLFFLFLTVVGVGESSVVAIGIFILHMVTLALLLLIGGIYLAMNGLGTLTATFSAATVVFTEGAGWVSQAPLKAVFFGFAAAMLGISGFESSSNFVEEQKKGVFPKTLRNMWIAVSVFNPAMAFLALALLPLSDVQANDTRLLAHMGDVAGGAWLGKLISLDATLVLSGAVLTSYVGVTGLMRRMTLDRVLPQFFLKTNRWRGTSHRIVFAFFLLAVSVLLITRGEVTALAGVYTISFLSVMVLFGVGNILLKVNRARLPRPESASWPGLTIAVIAVLAGIAGQIVMNPKYFRVFLWYFIPAMIGIYAMLGRIGILKATLFVVHSISDAVTNVTGRWATSIYRRIGRISSQQVVFFTRGDDISNLNQAMQYVRDNEHTNRIKVVIFVPDESKVPPKLPKDLEFLDKAYPKIDIEFVVRIGEFTPEGIRGLSAEWDIPLNFMFIGSPGDHFPYQLADLGGVRLII